MDIYEPKFVRTFHRHHFHALSPTFELAHLIAFCCLITPVLNFLPKVSLQNLSSCHLTQLLCCKHIAAFCYELKDFVKTRDKLLDNNEASCTSVLQHWNKPRKWRLDSKIVDDISFRNEKFNVESKRNPTVLFDPRPSVLKKTTEAVIEELKDFLQCLHGTCGFIHLLSKPEVTNNEQDILLPILRSVKARINHQILQVALPRSLECLQEFGISFTSGITPTDMQREMIEKKTRLQLPLGLRPAGCVHSVLFTLLLAVSIHISIHTCDLFSSGVDTFPLCNKCYQINPQINFEYDLL